MSLYARPSWRLASQLTGDLFVAVWCVAWAIAGVFNHGMIRGLAVPARTTEALATDLARQTTDAATQASGVPLVGEQLRQPFDGMAGSLGDLALAAADQVAQVERVALVLGWATALVPILIALVWWVPRRLGFVARAAEMRRLAASPEGTQLLALRALATQPLSSLQRVASDPVAAWRSGDPVVTTQLADLELTSAGVPRPRPRRR